MRLVILLFIWILLLILFLWISWRTISVSSGTTFFIDKCKQELFSRFIPSKDLDPLSIPRSVMFFFTIRRLTRDLRKKVNHFGILNPQYNVFFFDEPAAEYFLETHYPKNILDAYRILQPGAYRKDLFCLCFLYIRGGLYMDINKQCLKSLQSLDPAFHSCSMILTKDNDPKNIFNAFLGSRPGSPFLKACIDRCINNIEHRSYGQGILDITGPQMLGRVFYSFFGRSLKTLSEGKNLIDDEEIFVLSLRNNSVMVHQHVIMSIVKDPIEGDWKKVYGYRHYSELYDSRQVYAPYTVTDIVRSSSHKREIPRRWMVTFATRVVDNDIQKNLDAITRLHPLDDLIFYDTTDAIFFLRQHFPPHVEQALRLLNPGAFKADFFRYAYLYIMGGMYIDANKRLQFSMDSLLQDSDITMVLVRDRSPKNIFQAFLGCRPRCPFMKECVDTCVQHVFQHYYGESTLDVTGPQMMGKVFQQYFGQRFDQMKMGKNKINGEVILILGHVPGKIVFHKQMIVWVQPIPSRIRHAQWKKKYGVQDYDQLWHARQIFHPSFAILLTMYADSDQKYQMYQQKVRQWLKETWYPVYAIISSGKSLDIQHPRFHEHVFQQHKDKLEQGTTVCERDALQKALHSFDLHQFDFIVKITGKYVIPELCIHLSCPFPVSTKLIVQNRHGDQWQHSEFFACPLRVFQEFISSIPDRDVPMESSLSKATKKYPTYRLPPLPLLPPLIRRRDGSLLHYL